MDRQDDEVLEVCLGSACRDAGSDFLLDELKKLGGRNLRSTFCQGLCAIGPNVRHFDAEGAEHHLHGQGPDQARSLLERTMKSKSTPEKPFK